MINFRIADLNDAESLSYFIKQLDNEARYLLYDPNERKMDPYIAKLFLSRIIQEINSVIFIAETQHKEIIGFICGEVSQLNRISHVMKINIGVLKKYHGFGAGRILLSKLMKHASANGILRLEISIITQNKLSLNLAKKFGFQIEGIKRHSIKIGDTYHDEYFLSALVNSSKHRIAS